MPPAIRHNSEQTDKPAPIETHALDPSRAVGTEAAGEAGAGLTQQQQRHRRGLPLAEVSTCPEKQEDWTADKSVNEEKQLLRTQSLTGHRAGGGQRPRRLPDRVQPGVGSPSPKGQAREPGPRPHI